MNRRSRSLGELIDNWSAQTPGDTFLGMGSAEKLGRIALTAGEPAELVIEFSSQSAGVLAGLRLGALSPVPDDAMARAARLASGADVALVFVGSSGEWESEGADRPNLELVGEQVALIEAVAAANPRTIVVVQTGSPIAMPWIDKPAAVLQAWFPGQEFGNAIADVLFGKVDACGRLQNHPAYLHYPGENGKAITGKGFSSAIDTMTRRRSNRCFHSASDYRTPVSSTSICA